MAHPTATTNPADDGGPSRPTDTAAPAKVLYYFESGKGCGIRAYPTDCEDDARDRVLREVGEYDGVDDVRYATEEDASWVRGMGGHVPKGEFA